MIRTQAEEHAFWIFNMRRVPLTVAVLCASGMHVQRTPYLFGRTYEETMQSMVDSGAILSFDGATELDPAMWVDMQAKGEACSAAFRAVGVAAMAVARVVRETFK